MTRTFHRYLGARFGGKPETSAPQPPDDRLDRVAEVASHEIPLHRAGRKVGLFACSPLSAALPQLLRTTQAPPAARTRSHSFVASWRVAAGARTR